MNTIYHKPIEIKTLCNNGSERYGAKAYTYVAYAMNGKFIEVEMFGKTKASAEENLLNFLSSNGSHSLFEIKKEKLYISGPISGKPNLNKEIFKAAVDQLNHLGYRVINPHDLCEGIPAEEWNTCMRICIKAMMNCDRLIMIDNWKQSQGAMIEYQLGFGLGMDPVNIDLFLKNHGHEAAK